MADDDRARAHDVVVLGATGFVGRLVAAHLASHAPPHVRVALAGRSRARLEEVRRGLGARAVDWPLLVVDATDPDAVGAMAADSRVVATTVGPYARYGLAVVDACARAGTDYVDLTGEVLFVRDAIDRHHDTAGETGARIVHSCGFDSVPSDLSVLLAARAAAGDGAGVLAWATLVLRSASGGMSGGTVDSLRVQVDELADDPSQARIVDDPHALSPDRAAELDPGREHGVAVPRWDPQLCTWTGPFVMAPYNTRIVRRSNALQGWAYGRRLRYREVVGFGCGWRAALRAAGMAAGIAVGLGAMRVGPARAVLDRLLPAPGEGPDRARRERGHFRFDLHAATVTGARYRVRFAARGDPGYAATSVMMGECALALVVDRAALPDAAGVLTPATGIGVVLADRLRAVGFDIAVERV
ncbi:MAG TPA: saccharopine dehydrogenase NADP-binding domain-containing protein [Euzebyales bacterium]|nr:saccharopine dehydrogenase NADP-binding domain-containing protein [Euzebyales bacterium]